MPSTTAARQPHFDAATPAQADSLEARYALALTGLAEEHHLTDAVTADLEALKKALETSPDLKKTISDQRLARKLQTQVILAVASAMKLQPLTQRFLGVVGRHRRLAVLGAIITAFMTERARRRGEVVVTITSAQPLSELQAKNLAEKLGSKRHAKISLDLKTDPSLLGGLTVRMGAMFYDYSLKSKLERLGRQLAQG